ncbi:ATP-binding protein [Actinocorallia libanotica]|uniref:Histidine kinase/HSP90-like ATPase domain-containing protein n=1 Tax=Actinocorallia libanotica TaxID=46162 RepID=A0ABN1S1F6_9ACTN
MDAPRLGLVGWSGARTAAWELDPDLRAPGQARALTRTELSAWRVADPSDVDDVVLMVDELVANAVVHGKGPIRLRLLLDGLLLRGEISDESPLEPPPAPVAERHFDAEDGRGLFLVAMLSADSGCSGGTAGKTVWFTRWLSGLDAL